MTASIHKYKFSAQALITVKHDAVLQDKIPTCQQKDLDSLWIQRLFFKKKNLLALGACFKVDGYSPPLRIPIAHMQYIYHLHLQGFWVIKKMKENIIFLLSTKRHKTHRKACSKDIPGWALVEGKILEWLATELTEKITHFIAVYHALAADIALLCWLIHFSSKPPFIPFRGTPFRQPPAIQSWDREYII